MGQLLRLRRAPRPSVAQIQLKPASARKAFDLLGIDLSDCHSVNGLLALVNAAVLRGGVAQLGLGDFEQSYTIGSVDEAAWRADAASLAPVAQFLVGGDPTYDTLRVRDLATESHGLRPLAELVAAAGPIVTSQHR